MSDSLITGTNTTDTGAQQTAATNTGTTAAAAPAGEGVPATQQQQQPTGAEGAATTEQKTEGEQKTEAKTDDGKGAPQGAPEKYEFKAPEGGALNAEVLTEFEGVARELNLPQEAAQKLIDKVGPKIAAVQMAHFKQVQAEWEQAAKADKEFGGEKLTENLAVAKKAMEAFGSDELRTLLNETGLGNHPALIRAFVKAGKAISEDKFVPGSPGGVGQTKSAADVLYDKSAK